MPKQSRDTLTTSLALLISVVWAIIALASIFTREYAALTVVTPVMLVASGFLFGIKVSKNGDGK